MMLIVESDGGSRGNPGIAGAGALVRSQDGDILDAIAVPVGPKETNNVAEYRGLLAGIALARQIDPDAVIDYRTDSKLVVEQMSGRWRIKHPEMRQLAEEAKAKLGSTPISYTWIRRNKNADADELSNEAMDAQAAGVAWSRDSSAFCARHGIAGEVD